MMEESQRKTMKPWMRGAALLLVAVLLGWLIGSRLGGSETDNAAHTAGGGDQVYRNIAGTIVRLAPEDSVMTVDHEAIEGFMPAMVMDLKLVDPGELTPFSAGDAILFDLAHIGGTFQAVRLRPAGTDWETMESSHREHENPLGRGDIVPDIELYNASGERFRLRDMEPRHKVITFFFVRCPLQDYCPAQSQRLSQLQQHTAESASGVHLVSLTLDAEFDGPETLADYAQRFQADPSQWTLAGSEDADAIREFADRAGGRIQQHESTFAIDHALIGLRVDGDRIVDLVYGLEAIENLVRAL